MSLFYERLNKLEIYTYQEYLNSNYWKETKKRYRRSKLPKKCLGCGNKRFQLHHRSYVRIGNELPADLIPLCGDCHKKVHDFLKASKTELVCTHKVLRKIFGWSRKQTRKKFRPFSTSKKGFGWIPKEKQEEKKIDTGRKRFDPVKRVVIE